ncbi:MAG TPA: hypothetical protein P5087_01205 [Eubacteriales bacterium]|nr:hypothetical protein [Eubacteriales bacterium]
MKSYLIPIKNDLYDIAARLNEIDDCYRVFYNNAKGRYEVHRQVYGKTEFAFVVPYQTLDARAVEYALITKAENIEKLAKQIDIHNDMTQKTNADSIKNKITKITEVERYENSRYNAFG